MKRLIAQVIVFFYFLGFLSLVAQDKKWLKEKEKVDKAVEKSPDNYKKWLKRGEFYLDFAQNLDNYNIEEDAIIWAFESFEKADKLKANDKKVTENMMLLHPVLINVGATAYENEQTEKALQLFSLAQKTNPKDTLPYMYAGVVAYHLQDFEAYEQSIKKLLDFSFNEKPDYYTSLISYYLQEEIFEKAKFSLENALTEYPNHINIRHLEIKYLIKTMQLQEAKTEIEEQLSLGNLPAEMYYNLGLIYETQAHELESQIQDTANVAEAKRLKLQKDHDAFLQEAVTNYRKCLQVTPDYHYATFNLGVIYFNQAVSLYRQLDKMSIKEFKGKKSSQIQKESNLLFTKSKPYFEELKNVSDLEKDDKKMVLEALFIIYQHLEETEKMQAIEQNLKAIE